MLLEHPICDALAHLRCRFEVEGALLHGSRSLGKQHASSDVDLLILHKRDRVHTVISKLSSTSIDAVVANNQHFTRRLAEWHPSNNHWMLRAFATGLLLLTDADGKMEALGSDARKMWNAGPRQLSSYRLKRVHSHGLLIGAAAEKLSRALPDPGADEEMANVQCALWLDMLVQSYCQLHRLWSNSVKHLRYAEGNEYKEIRLAIASFLQESALKNRTAIIEDFASLIATQASRKHQEHAIFRAGTRDARPQPV